MSSSKKSALFVCLGNICRSPIAEAVFVHVAEERGLSQVWTADSAATGDWHTGKQPDKRARDCMKTHNVHMKHSARQLSKSDFSSFDYIFGMDQANIDDIKSVAPKQGCKAIVEMFGNYDPQGDTIIRDPYYDSGDAGFEKCYVQCVRCANAFFDKVAA